MYYRLFHPWCRVGYKGGVRPYIYIHTHLKDNAIQYSQVRVRCNPSCSGTACEPNVQWYSG